VKRLLVANRGEIAVRVLRACVDEGVESVAAVSDADRESMAALAADHSVCIGPAAASESYLDVGRVIAAALATGCDALHPGYGFLSERPELAEACAENGIAFVGPPAEAIRRGGDKALARELAVSLGIPVGSGSEILADGAAAATAAERVGFPVVLKAAAGGGGRGMVRVDEPGAVEAAFAAASREAEQAFGDGRMYLESFVVHARHVEVQVLADQHGNAVHLFERDCSAQRRYQKLIEEAPAPALPDGLREALYDAALKLVAALGYVGAGTVEFIVDADRATFAFLELNTRLQVEHPVTEMVTGFDIVRAQLRIAAGRPLDVAQADLHLSGHAIEARVNAEDPDRDFAPGPGLITRWIAPVGSDVRVDSHCFGGYTVPPYYDSLLAKVIARGPDRDAAIAGLDRALAHLVADGVTTTAPIARELITSEDFGAVRHHTRWVESYLAERTPASAPA
jgi:acetyl-CoA carboxylase biotin carboxylase subunit